MSEDTHQEWLIEDCVLLFKIGRQLNAESSRRYEHEISALMDQSSAPLFHAIIDARSLESYPPLNAGMNSAVFNHSRMGWFITIGGAKSPVLRFLLTVLITPTRIRYKDVATLEEAVAFLQAQDQALPPMSLEAVSPAFLP